MRSISRSSLKYARPQRSQGCTTMKVCSTAIIRCRRLGLSRMSTGRKVIISEAITIYREESSDLERQLEPSGKVDLDISWQACKIRIYNGVQPITYSGSQQRNNQAKTANQTIFHQGKLHHSIEVSSFPPPLAVLAQSQTPDISQNARYFSADQNPQESAMQDRYYASVSETPKQFGSTAETPKQYAEHFINHSQRAYMINHTDSSVLQTHASVTSLAP